MKRKLVLFGLIFLIPMMLSGCLLPPFGFVVDDRPHGYYDQPRDQHQNHHHDHSYQPGWRGHRR